MVNHVIDTRQFKSREFLEGLFKDADDMRWRRGESGIINLHPGKIVGGFFYQPSTRTRVSFEAAAQRIGAGTVFTENAKDFSSAFKGESLVHSLRAVEECFDVVVVRLDEETAADNGAKRAASVLHIPYINAGDGKNQHPTQALVDLYTLREFHKRIDRLKVAFVGDIEQGRTIKSLAYLLAQLDGNQLYFVSPKELALPDDLRTYLVKKNVEVYETADLDSVIAEVDTLYDTRLQWEYLDEPKKVQLMENYGRFQITRDRAERMRADAIIMHPLPINTTKSNGRPEIHPEVDSNKKAVYFRQSNNGLYVRMALLNTLLTGESHPLYNLILDVPD